MLIGRNRKAMFYDRLLKVDDMYVSSFYVNFILINKSNGTLSQSNMGNGTLTRYCENI